MNTVPMKVFFWKNMVMFYLVAMLTAVLLAAIGTYALTGDLWDAPLPAVVVLVRSLIWYPAAQEKRDFHLNRLPKYQRRF